MGERIKNLSISIVTFNSLDYLRDCIDSIYENYSNTDFDIIVVAVGLVV